jgi:hypothetical protein
MSRKFIENSIGSRYYLMSTQNIFNHRHMQTSEILSAGILKLPALKGGELPGKEYWPFY